VDGTHHHFFDLSTGKGPDTLLVERLVEAWLSHGCRCVGGLEQRLCSIPEEVAAVMVRIEGHQASALGVRRSITIASMVLEVVASVYGLFTTARRWGNSGKLKLLHLLSAITIPSLDNLELATLA
jgi:hypothetical protein